MKENRIFKLLCCLLCVSVLIALVSCSAGSSFDGSVNSAPSVDKEDFVGGTSDINGSLAGKPENGHELYERKIIRTVSMDCETKVFDQALDYILSTLSTHGGYVQTSSVKGTGYVDGSKMSTARIANYTLRVPAESLDAYLSALRTNDGIRITYQSSSSNEITGTYYDITTRIATLEVERDALQQMLAGFTDYKDIGAMLEVQERLYNVIEEIESLKTQLKIYDDKVDLSTIELTLCEVFTYTEVAAPTFGERISEAFTGSWQDFAIGCQNFAVGFVSALPTLLVLAVIGGIIALVVVMLVKSSHKKKNVPKGDTEN